MAYEIKSHVNSIFNSMCYRIGKLLIDPGDEWEGFHDVDYVLLTHAHFDHIYGLKRVMELNPECKVLTTEHGAMMLADDRRNMSRYQGESFVFEMPDVVDFIKEGDFIPFSSTEEKGVTVYETPGHNPSCLTFVSDDAVFSGDAYIPGVKTFSNFPKGNKEQAEKSVERIKGLAQGKTIYPGHFVEQ